MKALHIGAFNRNVGDNIALLNARKSIEKIANVEWVGLDIQELWNCKSKECIVDKINSKAQNAKFILVGGGGLIEGPGYEYTATKYKLPFTKVILDKIGIPVITYGVGFNEFRGKEGFNKLAAEHLKETIDTCLLFSVRNDGSKEKIIKYVDVNPDKIIVVPDPGLLYLESLKIESKTKIEKFGLQPAWNTNKKLNENRFINSKNLTKFTDFFVRYTSIPHTPKDFRYFRSVVDESIFDSKYKKLQNTYKFLEYYKNFDCVVSLRGHGQLITIGANIPGLYLSTQDKVKDFSLLNNFHSFNVDIKEVDWLEKTKSKIDKFKTDKNYLEEWYDVRNNGMKKWSSMNQNFIELIGNELRNM